MFVQYIFILFVLWISHLHDFSSPTRTVSILSAALKVNFLSRKGLEAVLEYA